MIEENKQIIAALSERLERHDDNRRAIQDRVHAICDELRSQIDEFEEEINRKLEEKYKKEEGHLQKSLNELREFTFSEEKGSTELTRVVENAKRSLLITQTYELIKQNPTEKTKLSNNYELRTERRLSMEWLTLRKPENVVVASVTLSKICLTFDVNIGYEGNMDGVEIPFIYIAHLYKNNGEHGTDYTLERRSGDDTSFALVSDDIEPDTPYLVKVKIVCGDKESEWCEPVEFVTPGFLGSYAWKQCPVNVAENKKYLVDRLTPKIARKAYGGNNYCSVIANMPLLPNKVTSWSIRPRKMWRGDGNNAFIGVAPSYIDQNVDVNQEKCGWYLYFYDTTLCSGPPHNYKWRKYIPQEMKSYVLSSESCGVMMDTERGELSYVFNGLNCGVAYSGVPLDVPLVPCVIFGCGTEIVELDTSEVIEDMNTAIPAPTNVKLKSNTFDSITLTWNAVEGASLYQVEIDGVLQDITAGNTFTKTNLLSETEYAFRVRALRENLAGESSGMVKIRTKPAPDFSESVWRPCPDYAKTTRNYSLGLWNSRLASKNDDCYGFCTIIGNISIPPGKVTSWSVKVLKSVGNNGKSIYVGVAPSDINQDAYHNYDKCGWYLHCYNSTLSSGYPHYYAGKSYGQSWKEDGEYTHSGSAIGVMMDMTKAELSFVFDNEYLGVAYEGIPLDKPLVPCVLVENKGDSVELVTKKINNVIIF